MSDSSNLATTTGSPYTWANARFAWQDVGANRSWQDANARTYGLDIAETLALAESGASVFVKALTDGFQISESGMRFDFTKNVLESLGVAESYTDVANFLLRIVESIGIGEALGNAVTKPFDESLTVVELDDYRNVTKGVLESLTVDESLAKTATTRWSESIGVGDVLSKQATKPVAESLGVTDDMVKAITLSAIEAIACGELFGRTVAYKLALSEGLSVKDSLAKAAQLSINEAFSVLDEYRRHGNAVLSDMIFSTDDLVLGDFMSLIDNGHAPGYAPFRDFIPGDYSYRTAIFRAVLESINSDRARLTKMTVAVDVPDIHDRGTATITDPVNGVYVAFNRKFHQPPEVVLTLKGGTVIAIPKIVVGPDVNGFTAILYDPVGQTNVTGTFTWAAQGY